MRTNSKVPLLAVVAFLATALLPHHVAQCATAPELITEKVDLFEAGQDGYATFRIPGLVVTKKGTLLAYCEARRTGAGDWDAIDPMYRRSTDGGRTFEPPRKIADPPADAAPNFVAAKKKLGGAGVTMNNPVAIADNRTGAVHFLYCVNYGRCFYIGSNDDGASFSKPVEITAAVEKFRPEYDWKVIATGPGHGIQLSSGRLVVPVWLSLSTGDNAHHPSCMATIYSDDSGKTWSRGDIIANKTPETPDPNETTIAQLADGRVMVNIRSESTKNRRLISTSSDGATGWSKPTFDEALFDPICFGSLLAIPGQGEDRLLFCNPDSSGATNERRAWKPRRNLTVRMSRDGGAHWPIARVVDPGLAGYCDLAAGPDGVLYCLYERSGLKNDIYHTHYLTLCDFRLRVC